MRPRSPRFSLPCAAPVCGFGSTRRGTSARSALVHQSTAQRGDSGERWRVSQVLQYCQSKASQSPSASSICACYSTRNRALFVCSSVRLFVCSSVRLFASSSVSSDACASPTATVSRTCMSSVPERVACEVRYMWDTAHCAALPVSTSLRDRPPSPRASAAA
jgi:hypothetical protein